MSREVPGTIRKIGSNVIPYGWLPCIGGTAAVAQYPALSAWIGTAFNTGGEPLGFFRLPNIQRRTLVGSGGTGTATLGNVVGNTGGEETHTLTKPEMPVHAHNITDPGHAHTTNAIVFAGGGDIVFDSGSNDNINAATINAATTGISINNEGGGGSHNNIQPSLVVTWIIKT